MQNIKHPSAAGHGLQETEQGLEPLWFTCSQFPPCLSRRPPRPQKINVLESYSADCETTDYNENQPQPKRRRRHKEQQPLPTASSESEPTLSEISDIAGESNEDSDATDC